MSTCATVGEQSLPTRYQPLFETAGQGTYVAMGDSFSSGDILPTIAGSGDCQRSTAAYPIVSNLGAPNFVACSGATSQQMAKKQFGALSTSTKLVSVTAGGDDANLFGVFEVCAIAKMLNGKPCATIPSLDQWSGQVGTGGWVTLQQTLTSFYQQIASDAPNARIFVLGYPNHCHPSLRPVGARA